MPPSQVAHLRQTGLLSGDSLDICLLAKEHIKYLQQSWSTERNLRTSFVSLDSSRPWMLYWTVHACDLLGHTLPDEDCERILNTIKVCWTDVVPEKSGGFGGGISQMPHAATTYAAVNMLCILASYNPQENEFAKQALQYLTEIRQPLFQWMMTLREEQATVTGVAIRMHHDGEMDVRASYCVLAVAKLLGILKPELTNGLADYLISCQTYEGGFGGEPWTEAHGGYAFCASAALFILRQLHQADMLALTQWLTARQMSYEGGFSGRSNKLVDGCYSFWQGSATAIVSAAHGIDWNATAAATSAQEDPWLNGTCSDSSLLMDEGMLQRYILLCAQDVTGGLRDKPSKRRDFYHSCYNLSGLSVAQHCGKISYGHSDQTRIRQTHPVYNIRIDRVRSILSHFEKLS